MKIIIKEMEREFIFTPLDKLQGIYILEIGKTIF
jgi:hypothetical protein